MEIPHWQVVRMLMNDNRNTAFESMISANNLRDSILRNNLKYRRSSLCWMEAWFVHLNLSTNLKIIGTNAFRFYNVQAYPNVSLAFQTCTAVLHI